MTGTTPIDTVIQGDCLEEMKKLPDRSIDAIVTDPPYELAFMGKKWDASGIAYNVEMWGECLRVLKPGGHLLAFGGSRTYHRMACAIEDAGFEIRDSIHWVYGCLSPDTEIMINGKWERYHKANIGDLTICYNNETDSYSWQPIQEVFEYRIKDTAYRIQSNLTDQIVTRGHRCLIEREGKLLFCFAEEAAREHEIHIPVLEDLRSLLKALPMSYKSASPQEHNMFVGMCKNTGGSGKGRTTQEGQYRTDLPRLRQAVSNLESVGKESGNSNMLQALQWHSSGRGLEETRTQRPGGLDARERSELFREDERVEKSGMERRCNLLQNSRELYGREICPMPSEVLINGPERWLCNGAPLNSCSEDKAMPEEIRGCASYQPRPNRQPLRESSAIQNQPGPQEIRGAGITRTTLARIEPIDYNGIVWCVRVPTGAFVARRNGKIFVTGNSGFPKSLDISKALDKAAGAEREVIGTHRRDCGSKSDHAFERCREIEYDITAPTTEAAKQWAGWGSALKPAHEPVVLARKPLDGCTIAENVLRWGCGGLNVDGCRINPGEIVPGGGRSYGACDGVNEGWKRPSHADYESKPPHTAGRFPSNLIHDASPVVLAEFAKAGMTTRADKRTCKIQRTPRNDGTGTIYGKDTNLDPQPCYGDVGSAARFFQSCPFQEEDYGAISPFVYYAKSSRSERNLGLDRTCTVKLITDNDLIEDLCLNKNDANMAAAQLLQKVTSGLTVKWSIAESGESIMALCPWGSLSTTLTEINKIIESRILPSLMHSLINESIQDVNSSKEFGGNRAVIVEQLKTWILTITNEKTELALGASRVALKMLSQTSAKESWQDLTNFHSTVKPLALMRYLCRLITPPGGIILDPFGGSGTTGLAAMKEGFHYILIEKEPGYCEIARKRVAAVPARLDRWVEV